MIVLDASAAVDMVRETEEGKALASLTLSGEKVVSLELFRAEVANSFWKYCRAGFCSQGDAEGRIGKAYRLVDEFFPMDELYAEAFNEATRLNHPVYDLLCFVLARRNAATLFTLDKRLQKLCLDNGVNCVYLDKEF